MSSKLSAYTALIKPISENIIEVKREQELLGRNWQFQSLDKNKAN